LWRFLANGREYKKEKYCGIKSIIGSLERG
jgi:hypothetical protein